MAQLAPIPATACPVERLAGELARVIKALYRTDDEIIAAAPHRQFELEPRWTALNDRRAALEEAISHERATSPMGAMVQVMLVRLTATDLDEPEDVRRIERLVTSVAGFLEAGGGLGAAETLAGYYLPARLDPHRLVGDAVAGCEASSTDRQGLQ